MNKPSISLLKTVFFAGITCAALMLCSCVTPLEESQGDYMISIINGGDSGNISKITASPFLIDDVVIISPKDAIEYVSEFASSAGPLPGTVSGTAGTADLKIEKNLETDTFFKKILPAERVIYKVSHERGTVYLILGKSEKGIQLYGIVGPAEE